MMYNDFPIPTPLDCTTLTHELSKQVKEHDGQISEAREVLTFHGLPSTRHNFFLDLQAPQVVSDWDVETSSLSSLSGACVWYWEDSLGRHVGLQSCDSVLFHCYI